MGDFWGDLGKTIGMSQQALDAARKEAERLAREAQQQLEGVGKAAWGLGEQAGKSVSNAAGSVTSAPAVPPPTVPLPDGEPIDLTKLPPIQRIAYAGALFALASGDGTIDKEELQLIFELVDLDGLLPGAKHVVLGYIIDPPALTDALASFAPAAQTLRYALMLNLLEVAWANDLVDPQQEHLLKTAQIILGIAEQQYQAITTFVTKLRQVRLRGLNDNAAIEAAKSAAAGLAAVGVPIAAVYVSGSVFGLSAAGITSGLAALGLGLGMVPGIGVAVLLGASIFMGVRSLLDAGQEREKERLRAEAARKAQLVIQNLQEAINLLIERMQMLQVAAADAETNREAIFHLSERLRSLQQIVARRKDIVEALR
ncbi:MAG: hypothetical protein WCG26_02845 [Chloroflexales bacterium]